MGEQLFTIGDSTGCDYCRLIYADAELRLDMICRTALRTNVTFMLFIMNVFKKNNYVLKHSKLDIIKL